MIRISTLLLLVITISFSAAAQRTYVDNGSNSSYTINNGDSLYIKSGTFTGSINSWQQGGKITVAEGASFSPSTFGYFQGTIIVRGQAVLPALDGQSARFTISNYGKTTINGTTYLGGNATFNNAYGALLTLNGSVNFNSSNLVNDGIIRIKSALYMGSSSSLINNNIIEVSGNLEFNNTRINNLGKLYTSGKLTVSGGNFTNDCRMVIDNGVEINNGTTFTNNGLFWVTSARNNSVFVNSGTFTSTATGRVKSVDFENNGTVNGRGYFYFTGTTKINKGNVGTNGTTADTLYVYDVTRLSNSTIFDYQSGNVRKNVVYRAFSAPDTISAYPSCGLAYRSEIILPVKWNYFFVNVASNTPVLTWSSEQDNGTRFEIERSYDGNNFSVIQTMAATTTSNYRYEDKQVNTQATSVYYRIRAIEPTGAEKLSETRIVRFGNKNGIQVQASPNPFSSQFSISYQSAIRETISIRVLNMAGQVQLTKTASISTGYNSITIAEAASLNKGIYLVQLVGQNGIIATERVAKQ